MEVEQEEAGEVEEVTRTTIKMLQAPANLIDEEAKERCCRHTLPQRLRQLRRWREHHTRHHYSSAL